MKKLAVPQYSALDVYEACLSEPRVAGNLQKYRDNQPQIVAAIEAYGAASQAYVWCGLPRVPRGNENQIIAGTLSKKDMTDLYSIAMVQSSGPARVVYDSIMVGANGRCPFCGGIGQTATLDHFLPKANFPLYSVLPSNLVPCCRDCNTGKSSSFSAVVGEQPLHPYFDAPKFFEERWVHGQLHRTDPVSVSYYVAAPADWTPLEGARAEAHFVDYKLAARFGIQAGAELAKVVDQRKRSLRFLSPADFREVLLDGASTTGFDLNGWNRTLYSALAETEWFCEADFNEPASYLD